MRYLHCLVAILAAMGPAPAVLAGNAATGFTEEELAVAKFWADMGPTLRDEGIEAYAARYHEDFRHWSLDRGGPPSDKASAIRAWSGFHEAGHRITCTHVAPVSIDIVGDRAFARLIYEQTNRLADGSVSTSLWRMVDVFQRAGDSWQVLESNMLDITPGSESASDYEFTCPRE